MISFWKSCLSIRTPQSDFSLRNLFFTPLVDTRFRVKRVKCSRPRNSVSTEPRIYYYNCDLTQTKWTKNLRYRVRNTTERLERRWRFWETVYFVFCFGSRRTILILPCRAYTYIVCMFFFCRTLVATVN